MTIRIQRSAHGAAQAATHLRGGLLAKRATSLRRGPKSTTIAAYAGVFLLIISVVAIGYRPPQKVDSLASATTLSETPTVGIFANEQPSVDELLAINVATGIAERAELPVATNMANLSLSLSAESELSRTNNDIISKPQIVQPTADGRMVRQYVAKAGDTAQSIAQQFGLSAETVRWANGLSGDAIEVDKQLTILPVNGVTYTVREGDSVDSIAAKYSTDKARLIAFNDLELDALAPGKQIILPDGILPEAERPGYVAPRSALRGTGGVSLPSSLFARASAGNKYVPRNCTWWAYERRAQLGRPIGSYWGNASTWASYARAAGFVVNNTPEVGAILQQGGGYAGYGHVAVVEKVDSDGSILISEMNYAGNPNVTNRSISAGEARGYNYIH